MTKALKILLWSLLVIIVLAAGFGFYMYQTNPNIKAIVDNDESKLFYFPVKEVDGLEILEHDEMPLKLDDSVQVYTYFFPSQADTTSASIFFIHGSGGNMGRYANFIKPLVEDGFQVFAIDWRGFGKSNGIPTHANVLADTKLAFSRMLQHPAAEGLPVVVYGQSLGGQVAVKLTRDKENKVDALVLDGSIASFPTLAEDFAPVEFLRQRARKHPENFSQPYSAVDDIREIRSTPKLIIQSADDKTVRPVRGKSLFENARAPKTFWETKGPHIQTLVIYPEETPQRIRELMK